jgi:hypothetical protein
MYTYVYPHEYLIKCTGTDMYEMEIATAMISSGNAQAVETRRQNKPHINNGDGGKQKKKKEKKN